MKHTSPNNNKSAFTLIEIIVSTFITFMVLAAAVSSMLFIERGKAERLAQAIIDTDQNLAVTRMKHELRLSSLAEIVYYPENSLSFTAISFPMRRSKSYQLEDDGTLAWDTTVIYHSKTADDGTLEILRTEISDRKTDLTPEERQEQLNSVATQGNASSTYNAEKASTTVLLKNATEWQIKKEQSSYDGYAPVKELDENVVLGSFMVKPSENTLKLTVTGKNTKSSDYKIGIDTLRLSSCPQPREAEDQQVTADRTTTKELNESGIWSGYHQLSFPASAENQSMTVSFYNDRFEDTNFDLPYSGGSNTTVGILDHSFSPPDLALRLFGNSTNWTAATETKNTISDPAACFSHPLSEAKQWADFKSAAFRVIISGIGTEHEGAGCRVAFSASSEGDLKILSAYIDEAYIPAATGTVEPVCKGNQKQLKFQASNNVTIPEGTTTYTDFIDFPIYPGHYYAITFRVANDNLVHSKLTLDKHDPIKTRSFMIPSSPDNTPLTTANWNSSSYDVKELPFNVAVDMLHTTYPKTGTYISPIINTHMDNPVFNLIKWHQLCAEDSAIQIYTRSGSTRDLDNTPWKEMVASGETVKEKENPPISNKRYIQYRVDLNSSTKGIETPKLRSIAIQWPGKTRPVEIGGTFVNDKNYGQFAADINGQPLSSPLRITLATEAEIYGFGGSSRELTASAAFEVTPKN